MGAGKGELRRETNRRQENRGKTRTVRWIKSLWKGKNSTARKEAEKEEVLAVFRALACDPRNDGGVSEYVPWKPGW